MSGYLHEQTGLTAGTIAYDDELATDLSHLWETNELARMARRRFPGFQSESKSKTVGKREGGIR